ncbi:MAG: hypothetical protein MMC23_004890 [Stictis urceolatum]|nr:hypothetical protein [Stictis urceolata]
MSRAQRPEGLDLNTNVDRQIHGHARHASLSPSASILTIPLAQPEPVYIAPAAAANIVTSEVVTQFAIPLYDDDAASVSAGALVLINSFLDRLLFNFLSCSHSTSLASLRPAVTEVLKPKLAKEAIQSADDELQEYIGGDDDELDAFHNGQDAPHKWDLDLIWKRTRLRCMVYTRLGDMEEDDEEAYIAQESLEDESSRRVSRDIGIVSPAVAIFLTSILEFVGEHALMIAAHAAYRRHEVKARLEGKSTELLQNIGVEEIDMEKVALNPIMGRLWRSWRRIVRSPRDSRVRPFSPASASRRSSMATNDLPEEDKVLSVAAVLEEPDPAHVPLPVDEHDVDEIEVPGYNKTRKMSRSDVSRPFSTFLPGDWMDKVDEPSLNPQRQRRRSHSLPLQSPIDVATDGESIDQFQTPDEEVAQTVAEPEGKKVTQSERAIGVPQSAHVPLSESFTSSDARRMSNQRSSGLISDEEVDPAEDALQFDQKDYIINDHERATMDSQPPQPSISQRSLPQYPSKETSFLRDPHDRYSTVLTYGQDTRAPLTRVQTDAISPLEHTSDHSSEVSPIEPSDDEEDPRSRLRPLALHPTDHAITPPMVSPLIEPPPPSKEPAQPSPRAIQSRQRRNEGHTEADYSKDEKREAFVVMNESQRPTVSRPPSDSSSISGKDLQNDGTLKRTRAGQETLSAAPNLASLREMTEAAHDTSDEASSIALSHQEPQYGPRDASLPSASLPRQTPQKTVERRQAPPVQTGIEKAAVQRISPVATRDPHTQQQSQPRTSDSSGRPASRSITSTKGKPRVVSTANDNYRESYASRSSSDRGKSVADERLSMAPSDRQRSFEQLISSGETIQYTLTPQNMREIEGRNSAQITPPTTPQKPSNARGERVSPIDQRGQRPRTLPTAAPGAVPQQPASNAPSFVIHSGPVVKRTGPSAQPRDARIEKDNTKDFADFIRSTGPPGESAPPAAQPVSTRSSRIAREQGKIRTSKGPRLQAREPRIKNGETSELIDFIRQGPPPDKGSGAHRINRTVAPFRSTIDSDEMNPPRKHDTHSVASTQDSYVARSVQSSTNSRTALLDSSRTNNIKAAPPMESKRAPIRGGPDPDAPVRKQRRIKDPYAIDTDSEDEIDEEIATPKPTRQQPAGRDESLLDFLNSAPPPEASTTPPPLQLSKDTIKAHQRKMSNHTSPSSGGGVRSKLGISSSGRSRSASKDQGPPLASKYGNENASPIPSQMARTPMSASSVGRPPASRGAGAKPKARDPAGEDNSMRDLAAFLKDSAPPPGMNQGSGPGGAGGSFTPGHREDEPRGAFGRMFSRRRGRT